MPEKIVLQDGTEREVPTADEIAAAQSALKERDDAKAEAAILAQEKAELEQGVHPDWKRMREVEKQKDTLIAQLKEKGQTIDPSGNIVDVPKPISVDEIDARAMAAATKVAVEQSITQSISKFDPETQKVIRAYYNKLSAGEPVSIATVDKYLSAALSAAGVQANTTAKRAPGYVGGDDPMPKDAAKESLQRGLELAKLGGYRLKSKPEDILNK